MINNIAAFTPPGYRPLPPALLTQASPLGPQESLTLSPAALQSMQDDRQHPAQTVAEGVNSGVDVLDSAAHGGSRAIQAGRTAAQSADEAARAAGKGLSTLAKAGRFAGPIGIGLTAVTTGADVISAVRDKTLTHDQKAEKIGGAVGGGAGSLGGGLGGAMAGAAAGAVGGPPGILIGAIIGGVGGGLGGDKIGSWLGEKIGKLF